MAISWDCPETNEYLRAKEQSSTYDPIDETGFIKLILTSGKLIIHYPDGTDKEVALDEDVLLNTAHRQITSGNPHQVMHSELSDKGTYNHSEIDNHIDDTSNPHSVTKDQVGLGNVTNDAQLKRADNDWASMTEDTSPAVDDFVLIEKDTSGAKKKVKISHLQIPMSSFDGLSDVDMSGKENKSVPYWDSGDSKYKPKVMYFADAPTISTTDINENQTGIHTISNYNSDYSYTVIEQDSLIDTISISGSSINITAGNITDGVNHSVTYKIGVYKEGYILTCTTVTFTIIYVPLVSDDALLWESTTYIDNNFDEVEGGAIA